MTDALRVLHEYKYVHRDIKPENYVLGIGEEENKVYLIDFGLSKRFFKF